MMSPDASDYSEDQANELARHEDEYDAAKQLKPQAAIEEGAVNPSDEETIKRQLGEDVTFGFPNAPPEDGAVNPTDEEKTAKRLGDITSFARGLVMGAVQAVADATSEADAAKLEASVLPKTSSASHYS